MPRQEPDNEIRRLDGRCALVTGGSRGIGAQTSIELARLGAHVVVNHATPGSAQVVLDAIAEAGGSAEAAQADIYDPRQLTALLDDVARRRHVDILVANAAAPFPRAPLVELAANDLAAKVAADIAATHTLTTRLAPGMRNRGWGRLIYIGSMHADGPCAPGMAANGTSKAALATYVRFVTDELTGNGVTANLVNPGFVATERAMAIVGPRIPGMITGLTPAGRTVGPADVADAVVLLATAGDMLNGITLPVSGGFNQLVPLLRVAPLTAATT